MATKIIAELKVIRDSEKLAKNVYKSRAYDRVIKQLERLPQDANITTLDDLKALGITGVGDSIGKKITEILETGELAAAALAQQNVKAFNELTQVHGIGNAKAAELIKNGITDVHMLREAVQTTPGLLNDVQKLGLARYDSLIKRIPRKEMLSHEKLLKETFGKHFECILAGSFRRGLANSGDIDLLITYRDGFTNTGGAKKDKEKDMKKNKGVAKAREVVLFHDIVKGLQSRKYITDTLAFGDKKCMAVVKLPRHRTYRRLDILLTPAEEYPYAILYFTGSQQFNINMRNDALAKGYTLNEHGMKPIRRGVTPVPDTIRTEQEIFEFLGLQYVPPESRDI